MANQENFKLVLGCRIWFELLILAIVLSSQSIKLNVRAASQITQSFGGAQQAIDDQQADEQRLALQIVTTEALSGQATPIKRLDSVKSDKRRQQTWPSQRLQPQSSRISTIQHNDQNQPSQSLMPRRIIINLGQLGGGRSNRLSEGKHQDDIGKLAHQQAADDRGENSEEPNQVNKSFKDYDEHHRGIESTKKENLLTADERGDEQSNAGQPLIREASKQRRSATMREAVMSSIRKQGGVPAVVVSESEMAEKLGRIRELADANQQDVGPSIRNNRSQAKFMLQAEMLDRAQRGNGPSKRVGNAGLEVRSELADEKESDRESSEQTERNGSNSDQRELSIKPRKSVRRKSRELNRNRDLERKHRNRPRSFSSSVSERLQRHRDTELGDEGTESANQIGGRTIETRNEFHTERRHRDFRRTSASDNKADSVKPDEIVRKQAQDGVEEKRNESLSVSGIEDPNNEPRNRGNASTKANVLGSKSHIMDTTQKHRQGEFKLATKESEAGRSQVAAVDSKSQKRPEQATRLGHDQRQQRASAISDQAMDERVARLLDRLKLYTTKDQLIRVAQDLQQQPTSIEDGEETEVLNNSLVSSMSSNINPTEGLPYELAPSDRAPALARYSHEQQEQSLQLDQSQVPAEMLFQDDENHMDQLRRHQLIESQREFMARRNSLPPPLSYEPVGEDQNNYNNENLTDIEILRRDSHAAASTGPQAALAEMAQNEIGESDESQDVSAEQIEQGQGEAQIRDGQNEESGRQPEQLVADERSGKTSTEAEGGGQSLKHEDVDLPIEVETQLNPSDGQNQQPDWPTDTAGSQQEATLEQGGNGQNEERAPVEAIDADASQSSDEQDGSPQQLASKADEELRNLEQIIDELIARERQSAKAS